MPESESKPKLIELMAPGAGQGWKAVLRNGKAAVVHEIPVPQAEATAAVPRLQRLFDHRHPALSPVLAWGTDQNGIWVAVEPNEGTPLSSILTRGPMTPPAAASLGAAVLSGVAALHETGIAMGGFGATAVRVTSNGDVRLAGHPAAAVRGAPSQSDLRADVRSCGMAVCAAFGVDPAGAPAPPNIPPGLVVTMRSMASGAMGPSADRALGALREMAAPLLAIDRQTAAQSELATRAGGREVPPITPFLPAGTVSPSQTATAPTPPSGGPAPFIAPPQRDEAPARGSLYEPGDRPVQTYPSMPAITFPPVPAPAPGPAASATVETPPSTPAIPTWAEAPPRSPAPEETPATSITNPALPVEPPPAVEPEPIPPAPIFEPAPTFEPAPPAPTFESAPPAPTFEPAPAPAFDTNPPAPAPAPWTPAPAPAAPEAPAPAPAPWTPAAAPAAPEAPAPPPPAPTWTPVEAPVWKPGEVVPAEPLGTGYAIDTPKREPATPAPVAAAPMIPAAPATAPSRPPSVPRPRHEAGAAPSERPAWIIPAAVAGVVIILLGIFGVVVLPRLAGGNNNTASVTSPSPHATGTPKGSPSASPTGGRVQTVPTYAPLSAAPVSKLQICTPASPCDIPGSAAETATACDLSSCRLEVAFYFTAVQKSVPISYTLKFFDRCTGQTTDLPGTKATTPASGWIVGIPTDNLAVSIPRGVKSGALVAVSQQPAVAASPPLQLGPESC